MRILHIHQDYPDGRPYPITKAVYNLIQATKNHHQHYVLSIHRTSNPFKISWQSFDEGISVIYFALPLPLIYIPQMWLNSILFYLLLRKKNFDLIHAHKMTVEGSVGYFLSKRMQLPLALSLRGGTDIKYITRFPYSRKFFAKVAQSAKHIFLISVWAKKKVENYLSITLNNASALPNICNIDNIQAPDELHIRSNYICISDSHNYQRKGIINLIIAISNINKNMMGDDKILLDIYGINDVAIQHKLQTIIDKNHAGTQIQLCGRVSHQQLLKQLASSKGLLLPSINETFGMAYVEALATGAPILYHSDTGIDGYFDDEELGVCVQNQSVEELVRGIKIIHKNNKLLIKNISSYIQEGKLMQFSKDSIKDNYLYELAKVVEHKDI